MTEAERKEMALAKKKLMDNALEMCINKRTSKANDNHKKIEQIRRKEQC